jgi:murein DD-endopeptidase MepM/ murein hydrolase activator NlpD
LYLELNARRRKLTTVTGVLAGAALASLITLSGPPPSAPAGGAEPAGSPPRAVLADPAPAAAPRDEAPADVRATRPATPFEAVGDVRFTLGHTLRGHRDEAPPVPAPAFSRLPDAPAAAPASDAPTDPPTIVDAPAPERQRLDVEVASGDTLIGMLLSLGIARAEAHAAVEGLRDVYDPRRLRPGQRLQVETDAAASRLVRLAFAPSGRERIELVRVDDGGFQALVRERATVTEEQLVEAEVRSSLHAAAIAAGVPPAVLAEVVRIFSWDVDYQRETRPGDEIAVLFARERVPDGPVIDAGDVRYARLHVAGRVLEAFRFERDGEAVFFTREGESLRKFLLRTPVNGARMSSGFGMRRHPILGYNRMHRGVDFAAPRGTPIYAAGDGRLARVGRYGGYGNYVRIEHGDGYATAYAHLSRFATGMRSGRRVEQGEVIGYVGSTGRSTGPHLHFEVLKNGEQVDPLEVAQPPAENLAGTALAAFRREVRAVETRLAELGSRTFAADRRRAVASGG